MYVHFQSSCMNIAASIHIHPYNHAIHVHTWCIHGMHGGLFSFVEEIGGQAENALHFDVKLRQLGVWVARCTVLPARIQEE